MSHTKPCFNYFRTKSSVFIKNTGIFRSIWKLYEHPSGVGIYHNIYLLLYFKINLQNVLWLCSSFFQYVPSKEVTTRQCIRNLHVIHCYCLPLHDGNAASSSPPLDFFLATFYEYETHSSRNTYSIFGLTFTFFHFHWYCYRLTA